MNFRKIIIADTETDGKDPYTCNVVQIAAVVLDPRKLTLIPGAEFNAMIKPPDIDNDDYFTSDIMDTITFHARNYKCSVDDIIMKWRKGKMEGHVWKDFINFVNSFNPDKKFFKKPIIGGANIKDFDLIIFDRLHKKYGTENPFWKRDTLDTLNFCFPWFENMKDGPKSYGMDSLREYFSVKSTGTLHDALTDCKDCAYLIAKFLNLHRKCNERIKWK